MAQTWPRLARSQRRLTAVEESRAPLAFAGWVARVSVA